MNTTAAGFTTTATAPVDLPAIDSVAYPADGTLVTIVDDGTVRRGWITVDHTASGIAGEAVWVAFAPFDSAPMWTGRVAPEGVTVEEPGAPEWWTAQVTDLMQSLIRADRSRAVLVEDVHRWADEHSLCGVFDRFMRDHELPPRRREYSAPTSVTLTLELSVPVVARYGEDAQTLLDHDLVEEAVRRRFGGLRRYGLTVGDYTVGELQESAS